MLFMCLRLTSFDFSNFKTTKIKDMSEMFCDYLKLESIEFIHSNTSNIHDMEYILSNCENLLIFYFLY